MKKLENLSRLACKAAVEAANSILEISRSSEFEIKNKADHTPVTEADYVSDRIIQGILKSTGISVISEESYPNQLIPITDSSYWLVDPLDGTKGFIKRNGEFCINVALISEQTPVLGIIAIPVGNVIYRAIKGEGISKAVVDHWDVSHGLNFVPVNKPDIPQEFSNIVFLKSRNHQSVSKENLLESQLAKKFEIHYNYVGSAIKFIEIIEGRGHVYHRPGHTMAWDTAAGHAMLLEFGGNIIDLKTGQMLQYSAKNLKNNAFIASLIPIETLYEI